MLGPPVGVHRVLSAANKLPPVPLDQYGLVESQLDRPRPVIDRPSLHINYLQRSVGNDRDDDTQTFDAGRTEATTTRASLDVEFYGSWRPSRRGKSVRPASVGCSARRNADANSSMT